MSINYSRAEFESATETEIAQIWEDCNTVKVRKKNGRSKRLHIFDCDYLEDMDVDMLEKDMAVYPPGFLDLCEVCMHHYRNGREL